MTQQLRSSAIVLHRRQYGDFDVIATFLSRNYGKLTLIAKFGKKSVKRFGGLLEPFANLEIIYRSGSRAMAVLEEASLIRAHQSLRTDIVKTAYASYWLELILLWVEEKQECPQLYELLVFCLDNLSGQHLPAAVLSLLFQIRFIGQEGLNPILKSCVCCMKNIDYVEQSYFCIDLNKGGVICNQCPLDDRSDLKISKGTLKQLQWLTQGPLIKARRVRFLESALREATGFLEAYVPYHIGRNPKSLPFLKKIRKS
ncbi:MAG: DNA repair protein RecO [Desulfobacteraceae bacterium]|nr:DNA repair protein RecO [Desulfobacteraceae bacterium]